MITVNSHSDYAIQAYRERLLRNRDALKEDYLPRLKQGGVNLEVIQVACDFFTFQGLDLNDPRYVLASIDSILMSIQDNPDDFLLITRNSHIDELESSDKIGFLLSIEGAASIDERLAFLRTYFRLGLRAMALTHNLRNIFAEGCRENRTTGLSEAGKNLIREIDSLPLLLDLSHINERCFFEALDIYQKPPIVSHSNTRAVHDHFRNLTDEQIKAVAQKNGVIGLNFMSLFTDRDIKQASVKRLIDHLDHIVSITGINHIGLGPDYTDYLPPPDQQVYVKGSENITEFSALRNVLSKRGYGDQDIDKIMGENFIRVFREVLEP
jgi:membrane dipeptidase